jgi:hypothetical protein
MIHNTLIAIHAAGGIISFIIGVLILFPLGGGRINLRFLSMLFLGALVLMLIFLITVVVTDWPSLDNVQRAIFGGLNILGLYMIWRAFQAYQLLLTQPSGWEPKYTGHIGFNLISLFEGFVIISAIDLGAPGWLVGLLAVLGVVIGRWVVHLASSRFVGHSL